ncbi:MAG: DPP IV N-terminal domain-containing protein [Lewinellaceae bacterium]|nr:DPP IV N-terminal domain-containing protein [Lewinellaceae bacterium]
MFEETSDKWAEPENPPVFVPGSNTDFIWQSERNGYTTCTSITFPEKYCAKSATEMRR